jgi:hypothetical protein
MHAPTPAAHLCCADDRFGFPVATLDQDFRAAGENEGERRVLLEPGDYLHGLEGGNHRHAVRQRVQGSILVFTQAFHGSVAIDRDKERCPQGASLGEIGDVAAMQYVEHAVGEHERARVRREPRRKLLRRTDLLLEGGSHQELSTGRPREAGSVTS